MERTHTDILKGLVSAGKRWRYGEKADNLVTRRIVWELMHIIKAEHVDYYLMAFWVFKYSKQGINYWARGAMPSSIVCYCLGLTEVDPIKYGLHSARFVNDEQPKFQFDIETSRFDEFMKGAEDLLQANAKDYDIPAIRECLFKDLKPSSYLSKKKERPLPDDLEDEFARYALYFPQTMDLFTAYVNRYPKCDFLIYQEQMLDILREVFHVGGIKANQIRLSIQRGETEPIEAYKQEVFEASDLSTEEKEKAWQRLTSNPRAFLKAHAVSSVLASYKYEWPGNFIKKWKEIRIREYNEGLAGVKDADGKWGFIDKTGKLVIPCQWKKALWFSEGLAGVQDDNEKWGFIDKIGKVVIPFKWKIVNEFHNGLANVQDDNENWGYIDKTGKLAIPCQWKRTYWFYEGLASVEGNNENWGYIDKTGKLVVPYQWKEAFCFHEGLAQVMNADGRWGFIDKTGNLVLPCLWKEALWFSEGLAGVQDDNEKWGFIDKTGKVVLLFEWSNVQWFRNGRVRVQTVLGGGWHDIDREGNDVQ